MKALHFYGFFADVINILKESKKLTKLENAKKIWEDSKYLFNNLKQDIYFYFIASILWVKKVKSKMGISLPKVTQPVSGRSYYVKLTLSG